MDGGIYIWMEKLKSMCVISQFARWNKKKQVEYRHLERFKFTEKDAERAEKEDEDMREKIETWWHSTIDPPFEPVRWHGA